MNSTPLFRSILILCEGNHCRSPIAEALFQTSLGSEVKVESAGLNALEGHPADPEAQLLMSELGIDISTHRGRQLTPAMALAADLILVMEQQQKDRCERMIPSTRGRVFLLGHWLASPPTEIEDPFHQSAETYRSTLEIINHAVAGWLPRMTLKQRSA